MQAFSLDERRVQNEEEAECQPVHRDAQTERSEEHFQSQEEGEEEELKIRAGDVRWGLDGGRRYIICIAVDM